MKKVCSLLYILLLTSLSLHAQTSTAPEPFTFTEVVLADSLAAPALYESVKNWLIQQKFRIIPAETDSLAGKISATYTFPVYARGYLTKRIHGKISYKAVLEVKEGKYRYTFIDFTFHHYKEDRYHNLVPSGKLKSLSDEKAAGWQDLWDDHRALTKIHMEQSIANLQGFITESVQRRKAVVTATSPAKKVDW